MKNKISIVLYFVLLYLFISCNQKEVKTEYVEVQHYETGEVHIAEKKINEREFEVRYYYRSGQILTEGMVRDSLREGAWNEYYNDGVLRGEIVFSKGRVVSENIKYPIILDFKDNPSEFKIGNTYKFRTLGVSAFYSIAVPAKLGYKPILVDDFNDVQYLEEITPQEAGDYNIRVFIREIKNDTIVFNIRVVD